MVIRTRDGYPCAHPHLSSDLLATQDRPTSYRSPVYASGYHAPHRENGVQRVTINPALQRHYRPRESCTAQRCRASDPPNLIEAFAKCGSKTLEGTRSRYIESL